MNTINGGPPRGSSSRRSPINGPWPDGSDEAQLLIETAAQAEVVPSPASRARVWSAIEARRRRGARFAWRLGLAGAGFAAVAVGLWLRRAPSELPSGQSFTVAATERRKIDLHGVASVVLSDGAQAQFVEDDAQGMVVRLDRGSLLAQVSPRPATAPFRVRTPRAEVKVVGTVLWVSVDGAGEATVAVGHGAVEVTPIGGAAVRVGAGQRWPTSARRSPTSGDIALLGASANLTWAGELAAVAPPIAPVAALPAVAAAATPQAPLTVAPPRRAARACGGLSGKPGIDCLQRVAAGSDPLRAESALFELGWRRLHDHGDARAALGAWESQRRRFPSGALRSDADVSIIEALGRLGDDAQARREIDRWLAAHPDGLAAPQVHYLRGSLERRAGDCPGALQEFDLALRAPADPWAADARAERAACQRAGAAPHH